MKRFKSNSLFSFFIFLLFYFLIFIPKAEATITLKIMVVNPSEQTQSVPVKVYLPREAKPEDVLYQDDLEIAYDTQQGSYYAFREYTLEPKEVLEREIEIEDIWVIQQGEIESLRQEIEEVVDSGGKTEFAQRINFLYKAINNRLNEITELQSLPAVNPTQHISNYRYCLSQLELVNNDLIQARALLAQVKPTLRGGVWKLFVFIILFLGLLGLTFYIIWQRQVKLLKEVSPKVPQKLDQLPETLEYKREEKEKPASPTDIEKILREEEEP